MKKALAILLLSGCGCVAQQTIAYTQFTFNKAGMNPAASGTAIHQTYYFAAGLRRQWTSFDNAPKQNFVNLSYTLRPHRSYRYWQNFSLYADNDEAGLLGNSGAYAGYAMHWVLRRKHVVSFGAYAGVRMFQRNTGGFDNNDPAVRNSRTSVLVYPDIIPGIRYSTSSSFVGLSVRQVSISRQRDFKGRGIGTGSLLQPTIYADCGRKFPITDRLLAMTSAALHLPIVGLPLVDLNLMYFYANRVGAGISIRNISFVSGILQVRFLENMSAGFSYSYPINGTRLAAQNTYELMIGIVPYGLEDKNTGTHSVARCPNLSY